MLIWTVRAIYLIVLAGLAATITSSYAYAVGYRSAVWASVLLFGGIVGAGSIVVLLDHLYPRKQIATISCIYLGLLVGNLLGFLFQLTFRPIVESWTGDDTLIQHISLVVTLALSYLCVSVLLQTKDDIRLIVPYVEFSRQERRHLRPLVLDAGVIIDGRIGDLAETGFTDRRIVVPRFVLDELQSLADHHDKARRMRGKRALDVLARLRNSTEVEFEMSEVETDAQADIDTKLISVAKTLDGKIVTGDANLIRLAKIQQVPTVNINEVGNAAKPPVSWGQTLSVKLVKEGEEPGQGIGYLDDGTMVVVDMGKSLLGHEVKVIVTSVLQTNAGRMVFARLEIKKPQPVSRS